MPGFDEWLQDESATQTEEPQEPYYPGAEPCDVEEGW